VTRDSPSRTQPAPGGRLVFVGERRSARARQINASWTNGRLAARTLHAALRASGIDPASAIFLNLFEEGDSALVVNLEALARLRELAAAEATIVGLGRKVQRALARSGITFLPLTHPAARGRIRARTAYQAHVASVLAVRQVA